MQIIFIAGCGGGADAEKSIEIEIVDEIEIIDFSPYSGQVTKSSASWYVINSTPPFGPRDHASIIKVNDRIHLMGGFYRWHSTYQDYWISDDSGISWQLIHGSQLPLRNDLTYPVLYPNPNIPDDFDRFSFYDSYYWLIGKNVWYSTDGIVWFKHESANGSEDLVNINLQGVRYSIDPSRNLIWDSRPDFKRSKDRQINPNFNNGGGGAVYSIGKHLYIAGGIKSGFKSIVWRGLDGTTWKRVVDRNYKDIELPWVNIQWPCVVEDNKGRVFLIGGYNVKTKRNSSDIWYISDGINWLQYQDMIAKDAASALFPRHASACVFDELNNRIISIGGKGGVNPDNDTSFVTKDIIGIPIP